MKILVIKTSSFGDLIHTFPVVDWIHQKFPLAEIDWIVEAPFSELMQAHPNIHRVLQVHTKKWRRGREIKSFLRFKKQLQEETYDVVFDLQGNIKSGLLTFLANANIKVGFGWKTVSEWPNLLFTKWKVNPSPGKNIRHDYLALVQSYFYNHDIYRTPLLPGIKTPLLQSNVALRHTAEQDKWVNRLLTHPNLQRGPKVMVCLGSAWKNKQMTLSSLIEFLHHLQDEVHCCYLLTWGKEEEKEAAKTVSKSFCDRGVVVVEKVSIPTLQHLISQVDLVISVDSLPLHLAGTTSTPTFSIFGASSEEKYRPLGPQHVSYQGGCPYHQSFDKRCPKLRTCPTGACIRSLSGAELYRSFKKSGVKFSSRSQFLTE